MGFLTEQMDMDFRAITYETVNGGTNTYAAANAVDMKDANRVVFLVNCPSMAGSGVVVWTVEESADTTDGNFSGTALTAYTATHTQASGHADVWKMIEVHRSALTATKRYLRLKATASAHNSIITAVAIRGLVHSDV
jgi:hypothetical protein